MFDCIVNSTYFGLGFSCLLIVFGRWVERHTRFFLFNHLIVAIFTGVTLLLMLDIPYETYYASAAIISYMLPPATALLALKIYHQRSILQQYFIPILVGCTVGCLTSLGSILLLSYLFSIDSVLTNSLLPKSVTTAIAMGIAETRGGLPGLAAAGVMMAGFTGCLLAPLFKKIFRIHDPVAEGLAIGACSHAMGTTKALELGEIQGAMSSIALCICGIITSVLVLFC